ncbi:MAG: BON domain-containing protein [bacterium]|nr:BON domain-containing protein [bacterium]
MPVVTISRQLGSLGTEIAQLVSDEFKCTCLDKKSLEKMFESYGVPKESLERFDERKPGFWDLFKTDKAWYLHFLKGAIYEFAHEGTGVILGRAGQILLQNLPGVLHIRVIAPQDLRVKRVMKRFDCDQKQAEKFIDHSDHERAGFHKFFFDENWEDLNLYDLIINTGSFSTKTAAQWITDIMTSKVFKMQQEAATRKLTDLCLQYEVKTGIVYKEKVLVHLLEVEAKNGVITLRGIVDKKDDIDHCHKIAAGITGIEEVQNEIYYSPVTASYGLHY